MEARWVWIGIAGLFALGALGDIVEPGEETVVPENSIFRTEEARDRLMGIYDERMADWPVPYEELDLETSYGTVHVIASGPADGEPVLLLHASGLSATSWGPNIEAFAGRRTYAIDHIGGSTRAASPTSTSSRRRARQSPGCTPRSPTGWASSDRSSSARQTAGSSR